MVNEEHLDILKQGVDAGLRLLRPARFAVHTFLA